MKLAEALSNRADLQRRISQLKGRLKDSAKVQEGDTPAEDVKALFLELDSCLEKQEKLVYQINLKSATPFPKCYLHKEKWTFDS